MILVAGSANLDFVVRAPHIPAPGETVLGGAFQTFPGGKGANQAIACARAGGARTQMLLALGSDAYAAPIEHSLREAGVQMHIVRSLAEPTGTAFICLADSAENAITVAPGANSCLRGSDLPPLTGVSYLLLQLETPIAAVTTWAQAARAQGVSVVLNAAPACELPVALLGSIDLLIVNEGELACLAGSEGSIIERMQRLNVARVIVTLGPRGCCALDRGEWLLQPAFPVKAVDTTAAGDTFCGALVAALSLGANLAEALRHASAAAALACTRLGAQASIPSYDEVQALLRASSERPQHSLSALAHHCGVPTLSNVPA
ncbi:ribokinase [Roseateles toxinivorans]|uniref:Ribokinase n=1 Tax=Roseateles toxinivorans TaxID=270368 RepID=A0A4R6QNT4_9BURK|nr:ribokinase [Roseateles toxinivorans]TDP72323.1 ribokinase [Roseateles toxinivorans]